MDPKTSHGVNYDVQFKCLVHRVPSDNKSMDVYECIEIKFLFKFSISKKN